MPKNPGPSREQKLRWRSIKDKAATIAATSAAVLVLVPLIIIFAYLVIRGLSSVSWSFLTQEPKPVGEGGGIGNAIVGSAIILAIASLIGVPLGIGAAVYLSEFGKNKIGNILRFTADVLNGVPSIVMGIAVWGLVVVPQHHFSAFAGGIVLGIMMIPTIARSTEEMLALVPATLREAGLGLGIPKWRTTISIVLRTATSGVITGVMLAFARVAGETAPLLFTALGNQYWNYRLDQPTAALPLQIYTYALSAFEDWHRLAWAAALVLIVLIVATVSIVRIVAARGTFAGAN